MDFKKLTIIIPAFNEEKTVYRVLATLSEVRVRDKIEKEIILVNDCSTDGTEREILKFLSDYPSMRVIYVKHEENMGKGMAIQTAIRQATGAYLIIQDADLELNPHEINNLVACAIEKDADAVYGSRFANAIPPDGNNRYSYLANRFLTWFSNLCSGMKLTDMETCYKLIRTSVIKEIKLREKRFGFEPEITAKLAKVKNLRINEVPVTYQIRSREEGKKIGWKDGLRAIYCIIKYNF